jgi:hypothetical protein
LKAIAALRAKTMHSRMPSRCSQLKRGGEGSGDEEGDVHAITAANIANGSAKIVWLKRIISRRWRRCWSMGRAGSR